MMAARPAAVCKLRTLKGDARGAAVVFGRGGQRSRLGPAAHTSLEQPEANNLKFSM